MNTFDFRILIMLQIFVLLLFFQPAFAGSGGGSGLAITPYNLDREIKAEDVASFKNIAKKLRAPRGISLDLFTSSGGLGLVYWRENDKDMIKTVEKVDNIPEGLMLPDYIKGRITVDKANKQLILNGLLTLNEKNGVQNDIVSQYNSSKHDMDSFDQLERALSRLYLRPRFKKGILFEFRGVDESGREMFIDFSEVASFKILRIDDINDRAFFEIQVFPEISVERLLESKLGYSQLKEKYSKVKRLWIKLNDKEKGELYFVTVLAKGSGVFSWASVYEEVEDDWFDDDKYYVESEKRIKDMKNNKEVVLGYNENAIWWAVPSVTQDPAYPYKHVLLK